MSSRVRGTVEGREGLGGFFYRVGGHCECRGDINVVADSKAQ